MPTIGVCNPAEFRPQNILGLYDGHNTNAALLCSGSIVAAVEEERFTRVKNHDGRLLGLNSPQESVRACLSQLKGTLDTIAVALDDPVSLHRKALNSYLESIQKGAQSRLNCKEINGESVDFYDLVQYPKRYQQKRINKILHVISELGLDLDALNIVHVNHHRAHAASVYYTSGLENALIITLDGKGDNLCGTVSARPKWRNRNYQ